MREGKEGKRNRGKGREEKGRGKESLIFPPNLSILGEIVLIKEGGKLDPSFSLPFLPPNIFPNNVN